MQAKWTGGVNYIGAAPTSIKLYGPDAVEQTTFALNEATEVSDEFAALLAQRSDFQLIGTVTYSVEFGAEDEDAPEIAGELGPAGGLITEGAADPVYYDVNSGRCWEWDPGDGGGGRPMPIRSPTFWEFLRGKWGWQSG